MNSDCSFFVALESSSGGDYLLREARPHTCSMPSAIVPVALQQLFAGTCPGVSEQGKKRERTPVRTYVDPENSVSELSDSALSDSEPEKPIGPRSPPRRRRRTSVAQPPSSVPVPASVFLASDLPEPEEDLGGALCCLSGARFQDSDGVKLVPLTALTPQVVPAYQVLRYLARDGRCAGKCTRACGLAIQKALRDSLGSIANRALNKPSPSLFCGAVSDMVANVFLKTASAAAPVSPLTYAPTSMIALTTILNLVNNVSADGYVLCFIQGFDSIFDSMCFDFFFCPVYPNGDYQ